uniref:Putative auto-transporter adhesin head GIN domain-containing protein n=1 Tax=Chromera velia CCMP2878 TaxID=1169474 RepID=A0A0G4EZQ8_9ALVE|eukprot:Cvel_14466.t1-p1 / transcript=Cvel_14466.t1 / gene=Cvel_14466 / organism=Chromera_velia_CCMP2878 / gene_product=hypothetical protein / transcript_product=hypothetical protein / location=Cvel_scaffold1030:47781-50167(-) / protein_length=707 / sequence_SO=supercontig / SO=protein_coding / is_pseudo=false
MRRLVASLLLCSGAAAQDVFVSDESTPGSVSAPERKLQNYGTVLGDYVQNTVPRPNYGFVGGSIIRPGQAQVTPGWSGFSGSVVQVPAPSFPSLTVPSPPAPVTWGWGYIVGEAACNETGAVITKRFEAENFDGISVDLFAHVTVSSSPSASYEVLATGPEGLFDILKVELQGSSLVFGLDQTARCAQRTPFQVKVTIPSERLKLLSVAGGGRVASEGVLTASGGTLQISLQGVAQANLSLNVSSLTTGVTGAGAVTLSGAATTQQLTVTGSAVVDASSLSSQTAVVSVMGAARASVSASGSLDASVQGTGVVLYKSIEGLLLRPSVLGLGRVAPLSEGRRLSLSRSQNSTTVDTETQSQNETVSVSPPPHASGSSTLDFTATRGENESTSEKGIEEVLRTSQREREAEEKTEANGGQKVSLPPPLPPQPPVQATQTETEDPTSTTSTTTLAPPVPSEETERVALRRSLQNYGTVNRDMNDNRGATINNYHITYVMAPGQTPPTPPSGGGGAPAAAPPGGQSFECGCTQPNGQRSSAGTCPLGSLSACRSWCDSRFGPGGSTRRCGGSGGGGSTPARPAPTPARPPTPAGGGGGGGGAIECGCTQPNGQRGSRGRCPFSSVTACRPWCDRTFGPGGSSRSCSGGGSGGSTPAGASGGGGGGSIQCGCMTRAGTRSSRGACPMGSVSACRSWCDSQFGAGGGSRPCGF